MTDRLGKHLFTFALVSDSHVNEGEDASASPFASNRLANARFRWALAAIDRHQPAFTVHLGDMANPIPQLATYERAAKNFRAIAATLRAPLHLVPGNHCVGDKPTGWVPVPRVSAESLRKFEEHFGRHYYSFDHGPCHFAVLNSLLLNSDLEAAREQERWLEEDLAAAGAAGRRIWVMMHYPPYVARRDEPDSYDNLDEPGRTWLLRMLAGNAVEAAYSGHVHNYFYNRSGVTHLYTLPATSFVRQDYSELYTVPPEDSEGGRNDRAKLGFLLVEVYEHGHLNRLVRTHGRALAEGGTAPAPEETEPLRGSRPPAVAVGIEMRENWLESAALRTNNSVSPFVRRTARNDWALAAVEEMGVRRVRISMEELASEEVRERMATLNEAGLEFIVYSYGLPEDADFKRLRAAGSSLAGWEIVVEGGSVDALARSVLARRAASPVDGLPPVFLGVMGDPRGAVVDDANVRHAANYGFQAAERDAVERISALPRVQEAFRGLLFRVRRREESRLSPWAAIRAIAAMSAASGMRHQVHVLFSGNLTAERLEDDGLTANRVAESAFAALAAGNLDLCFDTFEDADRGYYVRHGLVDRQYNPRPAATILARLNAALSADGLSGGELAEPTEIPDGRLLTVRGPDLFATLILPRPRCTLEGLETPVSSAGPASTLVDLATGTRADLPAPSDGNRLRFDPPLHLTSPTLVL